jgi:hypothetical protein
VKFFFDESGDFTVPGDGTRHKAGVVVGVAVADHVRDELERQFRRFTATLEQNEFIKGEPKGSKLCLAHQNAFGNFLKRLRHGVIVTPATLDLSVLADTVYCSPGAGMAEAVRNWIPRMKHDAPKQRLHELAQQMSNLSATQSLRLLALAYCFRQLLEFSITFMSHGEFAASWEDLQFVVDRVHPKPNGREEQVFSITVMSWLAAWSEYRPIGLIEEIHTECHPIVRKYTVPEGLELGSMLRGRIFWENSATSWGLQIADIAASIIGRAIRNPGDRAAQQAFIRIMRASHGTPNVALNVFTPNPTAGQSYLEKYQPLVDALALDGERRRPSLRCVLQSG